MKVLVTQSSVRTAPRQSNGIVIDFANIEAEMLGKVFELSI